MAASMHPTAIIAPGAFTFFASAEKLPRLYALMMKGQYNTFTYYGQCKMAYI
jgi:hypothetical protein